MPSSRPDQAAPDGEILVEAPTASQALAEVTSLLGPQATIVEASKVTRGGIGGFFARELVQLRAQPREGVSTAEPRQVDENSVTTTAGGPTALERLLGDLSAEVDSREETFGETLRRHLGATAEAAPQPPAPVEPEPPVDRAVPGERAPGLPVGPSPLADEGMGYASAMAAVRLGAASPVPGDQDRGSQQLAGGDVMTPDWSRDRLVRLGIPTLLLGDWQAPCDDLGGLVAFARAVSPLCQALPTGTALYAGPRAHRLADGLGLGTAERGKPLPPAGPVGVRLTDGPRDRAWLAANRQGRLLHLVVGGASWQKLLLDYPTAVSWCGQEALPDALRIATEVGLPLGYGSAGGRAGRVVAASPVEVAVAVRDLLVQQ